MVHLLNSAVRQVDIVGSRGNGAVPLLVGAKVGSGVVVGNGVCVSVDGGLVSIGDGLLRSSKAAAGEGGDDEQGGLQTI